MVALIEWEKYAKGFREEGAEEDISPKRDETTKEWRKLNNGEHNDLYSSPNIFLVSNQEDWEGRDM
jgi:hypothetical protein